MNLIDRIKKLFINDIDIERASPEEIIVHYLKRMEIKDLDETKDSIYSRLFNYVKNNARNILATAILAPVIAVGSYFAYTQLSERDQDRIISPVHESTYKIDQNLFPNFNNFLIPPRIQEENYSPVLSDSRQGSGPDDLPALKNSNTQVAERSEDETETSLEKIIETKIEVKKVDQKKLDVFNQFIYGNSLFGTADKDKNGLISSEEYSEMDQLQKAKFDKNGLEINTRYELDDSLDTKPVIEKDIDIEPPTESYLLTVRQADTLEGMLLREGYKVDHTDSKTAFVKSPMEQMVFASYDKSGKLHITTTGKLGREYGSKVSILVDDNNDGHYKMQSEKKFEAELNDGKAVIGAGSDIDFKNQEFMICVYDEAIKDNESKNFVYASALMNGASESPNKLAPNKEVKLKTTKSDAYKSFTEIIKPQDNTPITNLEGGLNQSPKTEEELTKELWTPQLSSVTSYKDISEMYKGRSYSSSLQEFYSETEDKTAQILGKILAGDYKGKVNNLKNGSLNEDPSSPYIWLWEDRYEAFKATASRSSISEEAKAHLTAILENNRYLKTNHSEIYKNIKEIIGTPYSYLA